MNLLDKRLGLLILVALTFFACEDQIGEISLPPENNLGIFFVETTLGDKVSQVWAESSPSSFAGQIMAGHYTDPIFGDINATGYCDISIDKSGYEAATISSAKLLSLELSLRISAATGTYSSTDLQTLELYQLTQTVENEEALTTASTIDFGQKIGEAQFLLHKDSINRTFNPVDKIDSSKFDSNFIYNYTVNFVFTEQYKDVFIESYIDAVKKGAVIEGDENDIDSVGYFLDNNLKGLAIKAKTDGNAIITFNISDLVSNMTLKYSIINQNGQTNLSTTTLKLNRLRSFTNIEPNKNSPWSNSKFDDINMINNVFNLNDEYVHFQSGTNMFITCDLSNFRNFSDTIGNVMFQRAELIIQNIVDVQSNIQNASNISIFISSKDSISNGSYNNFVENLVDIELPITVGKQSTDSLFTVIIPLHLQAITNNKTPYDQLIIGSNPSSSDYNLSQLSVKKEDIKLKYYYSTQNKVK